eukprot:GFUD01064466.1.p1 GENE.GFUD01064466.1~~GFUD01064466.1.p1  ORF type:complete len:142 (+),score=37.34 GFUD01064466.1:26-451(+)
MDMSRESFKENVDQLQSRVRETMEMILGLATENRFVQTSLMMSFEITRELSQKINQLMLDADIEKDDQVLLKNPQVLSALKVFGEQLDWINNSVEAYLKDSTVAGDVKIQVVDVPVQKPTNRNNKGNANDPTKPTRSILRK